MPWTYSGNPDTNDKDAVRFLIRDTDTNRQLFQDDEIEWLIAQEANIYTAAAAACDSLIFRTGGIRSKKIGGLSVQYDVRMYEMLAARLRARGAGHQVPYAGGISVGDKLVQQTDSDAVQPSVYRGVDDNPAAPRAPSPSTRSRWPL